MNTNKKILVVYYSKTGHTFRIAKDIAGRLSADIEILTDMKKRKGFFGFFFGARDALKKALTPIAALTKVPAQYDLVIIGTPIWASNMTPAVRTYLTKMKDKFKQVAFFTISGGTNTRAVLAEMQAVCGAPAKAKLEMHDQDLKNEKLYKEKLDAFVAEAGR